MKRARKPAVIARSLSVSGRRALDETDGKTRKTRSRKIPTRPNKAMTTRGACRCGGRPVGRFRRNRDRIRPPTTETHPTTVNHGCPKTRWMKNRVSTGTLPYQITMYCDQKKYIQTIESANWSLATSCTAAGGIEARPRALARTVMIDSRQKAV